jgi:chromosome segregation ATPase
MHTKCQQGTEVNGIQNSLKMLSTRSDEMKSELNALTDKVSSFSRVPSELSRLWDELATDRETFSREMTANSEMLSQINERVEEQGVLLESVLDELSNTP